VQQSFNAKSRGTHGHTGTTPMPATTESEAPTSANHTYNEARAAADEIGAMHAGDLDPVRIIAYMVRAQTLATLALVDAVDRLAATLEAGTVRGVIHIDEDKHGIIEAGAE
jgi:hypothetical protein